MNPSAQHAQIFCDRLRWCPSWSRRDEGVAFVEFALVLPLLLFLLFAIIEFGLLFNQWIDSTHLANEGARWAVVNASVPSSCPDGTSVDTLQKYVRCEADTEVMRTSGQVCISFPAGKHDVGDPVKVITRYDASIPGVKLISNAFFGGSLPDTIRVAGGSTMRLETTPTNFNAGDGGTGGSC